MLIENNFKRISSGIVSPSYIPIFCCLHASHFLLDHHVEFWPNTVWTSAKVNQPSRKSSIWHWVFNILISAPAVGRWRISNQTSTILWYIWSVNRNFFRRGGRGIKRMGMASLPLPPHTCFLYQFYLVN